MSSQEIKTRSVQHSEVRCLARTLHFCWPTCTWHKINEFDSTLALPWGRRFASEHQFYGVQAVCIHHHHPYYAKPVPCQYRLTLSSIAPFGLVTMALVIILFCCKVLPLHELGIMCWGTPPNPPTTPWILDIKLCCHDQMQACLRRLDVAILYLLLLRSTCHDPSFMSPYPSSFCEPTATHLSHWPTPYCINWFTPANVSMTYAYDAYGPVSWMRMHVSLFHKAWFDDEFFL